MNVAVRLTAEQVFVVGEPDAPDICRQRRGQADVWELHQASEIREQVHATGRG